MEHQHEQSDDDAHLETGTAGAGQAPSQESRCGTMLPEKSESSNSCPSANMYLVICNISKRNNVRSLFVTAAAFGCKGVFVVGQKSLDTSPDGPDIPLSIKEYLKEGKMSVQRFAKWWEFVDYIKTQNIRLIGVEIHSDAKPIDAYFDNVDTAFLMGNEGQGLSEKQMSSCDGFVRIPQYGNGTASLNVYVACSIILQRFNQWQLGL